MKEDLRQRMRRRQQNLKGKSGGKRRKRTRKRKGKGKQTKKYGNLKIREIKRASVKPTTRSSVKNRESVYELDVDALIEDEKKNQELLKKYNKTVEEWKKTPFYKPKKKKELSGLANQLEFQLRNRKDREMTNSLIQTKNPNIKHYAKMGKDKDGNVIIPKGVIVSKGGRRSRKKRKKLMCPKNCCGVPVDKCGCPISCPHCNCHEIQKLKKMLKKTRKKCNKRKKKTRRKKGGKKFTSKRKSNTLRKTIRQHDAMQQRIRNRQITLRQDRTQAIRYFRNTIINGQFTNLLIGFINNLEVLLQSPQHQTTQRFESWTEMLNVIKDAVRGRRISIQDESRISLMENLIDQLERLLQPNFDTAYLGPDSNSDEEATTENVD